jgi:hypothetical protein
MCKPLSGFHFHAACPCLVRVNDVYVHISGSHSGVDVGTGLTVCIAVCTYTYISKFRVSVLLEDGGSISLRNVYVCIQVHTAIEAQNNADVCLSPCTKFALRFFMLQYVD